MLLHAQTVTDAFLVPYRYGGKPYPTIYEIQSFLNHFQSKKFILCYSNHKFVHSVHLKLK